MSAAADFIHAHRRIILLVEATSSYARGCLRGIARYARAHGGWVFSHDMRYLVDTMNLRELQDWRADGIIARIENAHIANIVRKLHLPTVDIRGTITLPGVRGIYTDDRKVIEMAADHLISNGLKHLAFCGYPGVDFSDSRENAFLEYAVETRVGKHVFSLGRREISHRRSPSYEQRGIADWDALIHWLKALPKPVGVIACNDTRGRQILNACVAAGMRVPYDISVVGVDDDDVLCELSYPTLTSVVPNVEVVGFDAARLLDRILSGEAVPDSPIFIAPVAIEVRGSSDVTALTDPVLVDAVRFIRAHAGDGVNVSDILEHLHVSRSTFERLFREHLGCTPYEYILRCRIDRIKQLLIDTNYPLAQVAHLAGFRRVAHMTAIFRTRTGQTPGQYRRAIS